jgi:hypothetical protein
MRKGALRPRATCKGNAISCHVPCPRATHEGGGDFVSCVRKAVATFCRMPGTLEEAAISRRVRGRGVST